MSEVTQQTDQNFVRPMGPLQEGDQALVDTLNNVSQELAAEQPSERSPGVQKTESGLQAVAVDNSIAHNTYVDASTASTESTAAFGTGTGINTVTHVNDEYGDKEQHIVVKGDEISYDNGQNFAKDREAAQGQKLQVAAHIAGTLGSVRNSQDTVARMR